jgi:hypothetical protein
MLQDRFWIPNCPVVKWVTGIFPGGKVASAEADLVPKLRMCIHSVISLHGVMLIYLNVLFKLIIPTDLIHKVCHEIFKDVKGLNISSKATASVTS